MYKEIMTWSRADKDILWPWQGVPETFEFDYARRAAPGFIDIWANETDTEFVLTVVWQDEQSALDFQNSDVWNRLHQVCTPIRENRGITRTMIGEII